MRRVGEFLARGVSEPDEGLNLDDALAIPLLVIEHEPHNSERARCGGSVACASSGAP
jgi:hypothetical protein